MFGEEEVVASVVVASSVVVDSVVVASVVVASVVVVALVVVVLLPFLQVTLYPIFFNRDLTFCYGLPGYRK